MNNLSFRLNWKNVFDSDSTTQHYWPVPSTQVHKVSIMSQKIVENREQLSLRLAVETSCSLSETWQDGVEGQNAILVWHFLLAPMCQGSTGQRSCQEPAVFTNQCLKAWNFVRTLLIWWYVSRGFLSTGSFLTLVKLFGLDILTQWHKILLLNITDLFLSLYCSSRIWLVSLTSCEERNLT